MDARGTLIVHSSAAGFPHALVNLLWITKRTRLYWKTEGMVLGDM